MRAKKLKLGCKFYNDPTDNPLIKINSTVDYALASNPYCYDVNKSKRKRKRFSHVKDNIYKVVGEVIATNEVYRHEYIVNCGFNLFVDFEIPERRFPFFFFTEFEMSDEDLEPKRYTVGDYIEFETEIYFDSVNRFENGVYLPKLYGSIYSWEINKIELREPKSKKKPDQWREIESTEKLAKNVWHECIVSTKMTSLEPKTVQLLDKKALKISRSSN